MSETPSAINADAAARPRNGSGGASDALAGPPRAAVSAVLFDLDRTLIDLERAVRLALEAHLVDLGRPYSAGQYRRWKQLELLHVQQYVEGRVGFQEQRRLRARGMCDEPLDDEQADRWFAAFHYRMQARQRLFDDVEAALDFVERELAVPIGIVTNMDTPYQLAKLERAGLSPDRFACFLGLDTMPAPKPHRDAFTHACAVLGVEPGPEVLFIGDDLHTDAVGACAADLRGVWLDRPDLAADAPAPAEPLGELLAGLRVERITSLAELPRLAATRRPDH